MVQSGRVIFGRMEEVVFGRPAAEAVAEEVPRLDVDRVFLMVSGTLARETGEIEKVRRALGNRCAGVFDRIPPHTPRQAVIDAAALAREADADLIVTIGGGSVTDGAKAVQLCLANDSGRPRRSTNSGPSEDLMAHWGLPRVMRRQSGRSRCRRRYPAASSARSPASPMSGAE
jgi:alcohol dehydrogenase class IV